MKNALVLIVLVGLAGLALAGTFGPSSPVDLAPDGPVTMPVDDDSSDDAVEVIVLNESLPISGTVAVEQPVTVEGTVTVGGTVAVSNLADVQLSGAVEVTNLPAVFQVEITNPPTASTAVALIGFTSSVYPAATGAFGFTEACQFEFPDSRMCELEEALKTVAIPDFALAGSDSAWVWTTNTILSTDKRDCRGWSSNAYDDLAFTIDQHGRYFGLRCSLLLSVACCAP